MSEPLATEQASAVITDSAPVTPTEISADTAESAPANALEETVTPASEPEGQQDKMKRELLRTRKRAQEAEKQAAYYQGLIDAQAKMQAATVAPSAVDAAPTEEQFTTYADYQAASEAFRIKQLEKTVEQRVLERIKAEQHDIARQIEQQRVTQSFEAKLEAEMAVDPDFEEVYREATRLPLSADAAEFIRESDVSPKLIRYLTANHDVVKRLSGMTPVGTARELLKIEAQLQAKPAVRTVSSAPAPVSTVKPAAPTDVDPHDLPIDQYIAWRNKGGR